MLKPKSLRQRFTIFLLIPVALLLLAMGLAGFTLASKNIVSQWEEAAALWLEKSAHGVDMRLQHAKLWTQLFLETASEPDADQLERWIIKEAEKQKGIARVDLEWSPEASRSHGMMGMMHGGATHSQMGERMPMRMMRFHKARVSHVTSPNYDDLVENQTVSLTSELLDAEDRPVGTLEIVVRFDYLLGLMESASWWQDYETCLVDSKGKILAGSFPDNRKYLGDNGSPLEKKTLAALADKSYGTILGAGHPPDQVSGFYHLKEAPWSLVIMAPARKVLAPIIRFRKIYAGMGLVFILVVLLLIRTFVGGTASAVKEIADAAQEISSGRFDVQVPVKSEDEVGHLAKSFNTMASQLEERIRLKEALDLAMEVQQSLLPQKAPEMTGLDIAGKSIYCDETGGDYYDYLQFAELGESRVVVAVGDVVGHGISAALLMTTARAFLRSRVTQPGKLSEIIGDVNRLLCLDTSETGSFMTLFVMLIDSAKRQIEWVRAGHDPAIVYDPSADSFNELKGSGVALGFDESLDFQEYSYEDWKNGQVILIGTDGIWEAENNDAEQFGKKRLNQIIRENAHRSSEQILQAVNNALATFRETAPQADDVTLVVIKADTHQT